MSLGSPRTSALPRRRGSGATWSASGHLVMIAPATAHGTEPLPSPPPSPRSASSPKQQKQQQLSRPSSALPVEVALLVSRANECAYSGKTQHTKSRVERATASLVPWMNLHAEDRAVQESTIDSLVRLASRLDAEALVSGGGIASVAAGLRNHPHALAVQRGGCAIAAMQVCAGPMLLAGSLPSVHAAMQTHLDDVGLQRDALDALAAFAVAASDRGQGQAPPPGLSSAVRSTRAVQPSLRVQASLLRGIVDAGGVTAILGAVARSMREHEADVQVQRAACKAIEGLTSSKVLAAGGVGAGAGVAAGDSAGGGRGGGADSAAAATGGTAAVRAGTLEQLERAMRAHVADGPLQASACVDSTCARN